VNGERIRKLSVAYTVFFDGFKLYRNRRFTISLRSGRVMYDTLQAECGIGVSNGHEVVAHINGMESFWSYAKRQLAKDNGIPKKISTYFKEIQCRCNYPNHNVYHMVLKRLTENLI
jgi:hypothetical protein